MGAVPVAAAHPPAGVVGTAAGAVGGILVAGATVVAAGPHADRIKLVTATSDMSKYIERFTISLLLSLYISLVWFFGGYNKIVSGLGTSFLSW
jgi:hypothetical protein